MAKHKVYTPGKGVKHHSKMIHHPGRDKNDSHKPAHHSKAVNTAQAPESQMGNIAPTQAPPVGGMGMDNDAPGAPI